MILVWVRRLLNTQGAHAVNFGRAFEGGKQDESKLRDLRVCKSPPLEILSNPAKITTRALRLTGGAQPRPTPVDQRFSVCRHAIRFLPLVTTLRLRGHWPFLRPMRVPPCSCSLVEQFDRIVDIEENIWSPRYGIKGKVDATLLVEIHKRTPAANQDRDPAKKSDKVRRHRGLPGDNGSVPTRVPLELKTGKLTAQGSTAHRAQVSQRVALFFRTACVRLLAICAARRLLCCSGRLLAGRCR